MLAMIGVTDLTPNIEDNSYAIESEDEFIEWEDGNHVKHRAYIRNRVKGTFNIICSERLGMNSAEFLSLVKQNMENNILMITCWINNKAEYMTLNAYVKITTKKHTDTTDVFAVELEER